jgi:hypothetical protein
MARLSRILVPVTLAAGAVLLTACTEPSPAADASASPTPTVVSTVTSASPASGGEDFQPVDCGPADFANGETHTVVADPGKAGLVGCTEAINVVGEYLKVPAGQRGLDSVAVSNGWRCTTDDGETASIGCVKGGSGQDFDLALHTKPANG